MSEKQHASGPEAVANPGALTVDRWCPLPAPCLGSVVPQHRSPTPFPWQSMPSKRCLCSRPSPSSPSPSSPSPPLLFTHHTFIHIHSCLHSCLHSHPLHLSACLLKSFISLFDIAIPHYKVSAKPS